MKIGEIIRDVYVTQVVLSNAFLGFRELCNFYRGDKNAILGKIFDKVQNWWLIISK